MNSGPTSASAWTPGFGETTSRGASSVESAPGGGGGGGGGGAGMGAFLGMTSAGLGIPLAVMAVLATVTLGIWGVSRIAANAHKAKLLEVQAELEGALDLLEAGGQPEPPPPAWRKWIERRFHGARRLLEPDDTPLAEFMKDDERDPK